MISVPTFGALLFIAALIASCLWARHRRDVEERRERHRAEVQRHLDAWYAEGRFDRRAQ